MAFAVGADLENQIIDILDEADGGFGTAITSELRKPHPVTGANAINKARIAAGYEVLRAIAANPKNSYFGIYAALVTVPNDSFLPEHEGEPGIPLIRPFSGGPKRAGIPDDPDVIDSVRNDNSTLALYTGEYSDYHDHDDADSEGRMHPRACRYSLINNYFKYTGFSAEIPLIQLTENIADTQIPIAYGPTIVKLAIPKLIKPRHPLARLSELFRAAGQEDLNEIKAGQDKVRGIPSMGDITKFMAEVEAAQRKVI